VTDPMTPERVLCANPDHPRPKDAVARLTFPDGRFRPTTGCRGDVAWMVRDAIDEGRPILVEPITAAGEPADTTPEDPR